MARLELICDILDNAHKLDKRQRRNLRLMARYADNAFAMTDEEFRRNYRVNKELFEVIYKDLEPLMLQPTRRSDIPRKYKVLVALSFYATGSYQRLVGGTQGTMMSQQSVSRAIGEVTNALNSNNILNKWLKFPSTRQQRDLIKQRFYEKFKIPAVTGCIDGTHVAIVRPSENEERFYNRKGYHSRNVLIISDADLNILSVDSSFGGASHDTFVWNQHPVKNHLQNLINAGERVFLLDADQLCTNRGCCGAGARTRLTQAARTQLESALWSELSKLADTLTNRAIKFDEFFRRLLKQSREEFHMMFKRTYGMIYEQHSYVFEQLFEQLERYYTRGDTNFDVMMDGFFSILYNKMFTVLNSQYEFDEKYLKCVNEHMRDIQPFEDVPNKLSVQLRRAVVATRTFHKALRAGADVVRSMMQVAVTSECVTAWARLRYCGSCAGYQPPACTRYCHNVMRGCLPAHADLGDQWDAYVDAVDKVADRLLGPFNIAMVVEPIDIKISEAIMSFQEHNREISQKIFTGCGKPVLGGGGGAGPFFAPGKTRRSVRAIPDFDWPQKADDDFEIEASFETPVNEDPSLVSLRTPEDIRKATEDMAEQAKSRNRFLQYMRGNIDLEEYEKHERKRRDADPEPAAAGAMDIDFKSYDFDEKKGPKKKKPSVKSEESRGSDWGGPALEKLVRETRVRMRNTRRYWNHLPALLCTSTSVTSSPCFNGTDVASYTLNAASEGTAGLASNPEVRGAASASAAASVATQADSLRTLTARLKDAYNGVEVQWLDTDGKDSQVSSSFARETIEDVESGSGSGDWGTDGLPDDDEDRLNGYDTGSGDSPPDVDEEPTEHEPDVVPQRPAVVTEAPFVPSIVDTPGTNNVNVHSRTGDNAAGDVVVNSDDTEQDTPRPQDIPTREKPVAGSADRPSLQKALFTYALPVVCAWFGTIVTDLF